MFQVSKHLVSSLWTLCFKCLKQMGTTVNRKEQLSNHSRRCARYFYLAHICNGILHTIISLCINRINAKSVGVQDNYIILNLSIDQYLAHFRTVSFKTVQKWNFRDVIVPWIKSPKFSDWAENRLIANPLSGINRWTVRC